ncbi:hypothetical protein B2G71_18000 [Novosphingobium sp. PC22D]|uniref:tetratricopeptide repeat protein n=1 Tax=Novosphingobium sp. PC22D TaxID=1962403 RepID=UPI000BF1512F|nr:tetratricopeptide repeat protein [Novosphingobium sp. PC22D]PEQ11184.1 hypothetical protein B2G71_18000 [Novosphingobium sp. PC22D]
MKLTTRIAMQLLPIALAAGCRDDPGAEFSRAKERFAAQDYDGARIALSAALRAEPDNREMLVLLAKAQLRAGDADGAGFAIARAGRAGVPASRLAPLKAELALIEGKPAEALDHLEAVPAAQSRYVRAEALRKLGRRGDAIAEFERALAEGRDIRAATAYARMLLVANDVSGARRVYRRMREVAPAAYATRVLEGDIAIAAKDGDAAINAFAGVVRDFPDRVAPRLALASQLDVAGDVERAQAELEKAEKLAPDDPRVIDLKIQLLSELGQWREIRDALQGREADLDPESATGMSYAEALLRLGQAEHARVLFARAALLMPDNPYAQMMLGEAQLATGDAKAAWETLRPLTTRPDLPPRLLELAIQAARQVGDPAAASLEAGSRTAKGAPG